MSSRSIASVRQKRAGDPPPMPNQKMGATLQRPPQRPPQRNPQMQQPQQMQQQQMQQQPPPPPNKYSAQYAQYIGHRSRAHASARIRLGGVF